jgi:sigma-B regulation protein RsbU (phosphoserine phosphatase)
VYSDEDVDFLAGLARQVSIGLANSRLLEEQKARVRLENEMALAREIQQGLFPSRLPDYPHLAVAALNEPGRHVSGDYYDVIELPEGRVGILIADVTGEGVAASLLMANLQAAVRVTLTEAVDPAVMLGRWNKLMHDNTDDSKFITCLFGIIDPAKRTLHIASAGHPPPHLLTLSPTTCAQLELDAGFPLGIMEESQYLASTVLLEKSPCGLFCCTDGVLEAMDSEHKEFGHERTAAALTARDSLDPAMVIDDVRKAIKEFTGNAPQSDDITMLALRLG